MHVHLPDHGRVITMDVDLSSYRSPSNLQFIGDQTRDITLLHAN